MKKNFVCHTCGAMFAKWAGQCDGCGDWNSIEEQTAASPLGSKIMARSGAGKISGGTVVDFSNLAGSEQKTERDLSGIAEFDNVLGGGLTKGSAALVGGDPGIGKSTLLLQVAAGFSRQGLNVAYVSGEEAVAQIQMRAKRLGIRNDPVMIASETSLNRIIATLRTGSFDIIIVDSIQTVWLEEVESAPGSMNQVRSCTHELVNLIKRENISTIIVGHVTKEGHLAGPRTIEHMVDTVLYFEGERRSHFRVLRTVKNRFGPANEIGVFEMKGSGLEGIDNPSGVFLGEWRKSVPGTVIFAGIEGTRPVLVEIQALVTSSSSRAEIPPARTTVGLDAGRLAMILAVLNARCQINLRSKDIYLNVTGGLRIYEPAADLAIVAALMSAYRNQALSEMTACFGELCLSGFIRPCSQIDARIKEAERMGVTSMLIPAQAGNYERDNKCVRGFDNILSFIKCIEHV